MVRSMVAAGSDTARRILVVQDEPANSSSLRYSLEAAGYRVQMASSGQDALRLHAEDHPDVILLDLVLPDMSGLEVCRQIRAAFPRTRHPAIIVLSARAEEPDRVASFEMGADDFVTKPFSLGELLLRIQARLQAGRTTKPVLPAIEEPIEDTPSRRVLLGPLEIDGESHRVFLADKEINLSAQEMRLLVFLTSEAGKMCTRKQLLTAVWGYHPDASSRTLDTHIKRLRDKFGSYASMIQTVHGVGYRFTTLTSGHAPDPGTSTRQHRRR